jgi:hypothetical protein
MIFYGFMMFVFALLMEKTRHPLRQLHPVRADIIITVMATAWPLLMLFAVFALVREQFKPRRK